MELRYHISDILNAYRKGLFPMAEDAGADTFFFYEPELRGLLPINGFHVPKNLSKTIRKEKFSVTINQNFKGVIDGCAEATEKRPKTWINKSIRDIFLILHQARYAHSVEAWNDDGELAGGLYGLALGGVFFGESMFSRETDASKVALIHLMARLWACGYVLCDIQFINDHLTQFGAYEMPQGHYIRHLEKALPIDANFTSLPIKYIDGDTAQNGLSGEMRMVLDYIEHLQIQKK